MSDGLTGKVLDGGALYALAQRGSHALNLLDHAERTSTTLLVTATALAHACLSADPYEAALLHDIAEFGVVVVDPLTGKNADEVIAHIPINLPQDCEPDSAFALHLGHTRLAARNRRWPVVTTRPDAWTDVPGLRIEPIDPG